MDAFNDAVRQVMERTLYGRRIYHSPARGYLAYWSNASMTWGVNRGDYGKIKRGERVNLDANEIVIHARTLKEAVLIAGRLPEHPLYRASTESPGDPEEKFKRWVEGHIPPPTYDPPLQNPPRPRTPPRTPLSALLREAASFLGINLTELAKRTNVHIEIIGGRRFPPSPKNGRRIIAFLISVGWPKHKIEQVMDILTSSYTKELPEAKSYVGLQIREFLIKNLLTGKDLAKMAGLDKGTIHRLISHPDRSSPNAVDAVADVMLKFGYSEDEVSQFRRRRIKTKKEFTHTNILPGLYLRLYRILQGKTAAEVVTELGVPKRTLMSWERGVYTPSQASMEKVMPYIRSIGLEDASREAIEGILEKAIAFTAEKQRPVMHTLKERDRPDWGRAIRSARMKMGLSQQELGEVLGMHQTEISAWETGRHTPRPAVFEKFKELAGSKGIDLDDVDVGAEFFGPVGKRTIRTKLNW